VTRGQLPQRAGLPGLNGGGAPYGQGYKSHVPKTSVSHRCHQLSRSTNNDLEGWHQHINGIGRRSHVPFYMLVDLLFYEAQNGLNLMEKLQVYVSCLIYLEQVLLAYRSFTEIFICYSRTN